MAVIAILNLETAELDVASLVSTLSKKLQPPELARLKRFRRQDDALRFSAGRLLLRKLIIDAQPHELPASDIFITESENGSKPTLAHQSKSSIRNIADFNISHDGEYVLAGYTHTGIIGVDVAKVVCPSGLTEAEYINQFAMQLSTQEQDYLGRCSTNKLLDFYRIWAAKEAYVKALGIGIAATDLSKISIHVPLMQVSCQDIPLDLVGGTLDNDQYVYCIATSQGNRPNLICTNLASIQKTFV